MDTQNCWMPNSQIAGMPKPHVEVSYTGQLKPPNSKLTKLQIAERQNQNPWGAEHHYVKVEESSYHRMPTPVLLSLDDKSRKYTI